MRREREKGARAERRCVEILSEAGGDATRSYFQPGTRKADIDSLFGKFEVKSRARFVATDWMHEDCRGVMVFVDRREPMVILRASDAVKLMRMELDKRRPDPPEFSYLESASARPSGS